jgi:hypothetical protein
VPGSDSVTKRRCWGRGDGDRWIGDETEKLMMVIGGW